MRRIGIRLLLASAVLLLVTAARGAEPGFKVKPSARRADGHVIIQFEITATTDVEVAVLDAKGKVVRHLGAGLLGKNAPAPFTKNSLSQEVVWDGKGDYGEAVVGVKVRVRLGLKIGALSETATGFKLPRRVKSRNEPAAEIDAGKMLESVKWDYCRNSSLRLAGDPDSGTIYYRRNPWNDWRRGETPDGKPAKVKGLLYSTGDIAFGSDGLIYPIHWGWVTRRLDRSWKPAPFPTTGRHGIRTPLRNSKQLNAEGFGDGMGPDSPCLGLDGKLYRFASHPDTGYARVHVWGRDGKLESSGVFPFSRIRHGSVIRVDREGCLYVAINGLPEGYKAPAALEKKHYRQFSGTLVKLRLKGRWTELGAKPDPQAGKVPADAKTRAAGVVLDTWTTTWSGNPRWGYVYSSQGGKATIRPAKAFVHDVEWAAPGISWITPPGNCACNGPWFDMDRFGRLYVPDPALSRVRVLDSGGNGIAELAGKFGNLFIARPIRVAVAGDLFAFWDAANLRVLSAKLEYSASKTCAF